MVAQAKVHLSCAGAPRFPACSFGWLLAYYGADVYLSVDASVECALGTALGEVYKHSSGTKTDPVRAVRRQLVSWRQFRRYRRRALRLGQMQPSVFRSQKAVASIAYALQLLFDLASDSLKSFLEQKFLRRNYVDADTAYHLYRVASHLGDPYYETLCRSKLTEVLRFRRLPLPRPCVPLFSYHILTTRVFAARHPKIKDALYDHMDVVQPWASDSTAEQAGWKCCCADIVRQHPKVQLVDGHVACSASLC